MSIAPEVSQEEVCSTELLPLMPALPTLPTLLLDVLSSSCEKVPSSSVTATGGSTVHEVLSCVTMIPSLVVSFTGDPFGLEPPHPMEFQREKVPHLFLFRVKLGVQTTPWHARARDRLD